MISVRSFWSIWTKYQNNDIFDEISRWSGIAAHVCVCVCVYIPGFKKQKQKQKKQKNKKNVAREQLLWTAAHRASMAGWMAWSARVTARVTAPTSKAWSRETMDCSSTTRQPAPHQPKLLPAPPPQVSWIAGHLPYIHQKPSQTKQTENIQISLGSSWKNRQMNTQPVGVWHQFLPIQFSFFLALILYLD
jgi:hypothetical protein